MTDDRMRRLLIVSTEPTPYKIDLYNALARLPDWRVLVMYTVTKDWRPDAGHDFQDLPPSAFRALYSEGRHIQGTVASTWLVVRTLIRFRPHNVLINGYYGLQYVAAMVTARLRRVPFAMWVDRFNTSAPRRGGFIARVIRDALRGFVFRHALSVLVCGTTGVDSALRAGCPRERILNFPYVVDADRLQSLGTANPLPEGILRGPTNSPLMLFSGRLIRRKGLPTLLEAAVVLARRDVSFRLLVEGAGPLEDGYRRIIKSLSLNDRCWLIGFRQMGEHAALLSAADIVVVPSLDDPWGIVVHEAMLLGKCVCASDAVGSAIDRIVHGQNGVLFQAGDANDLAARLYELLMDQRWRLQLGRAAAQTAARWSPQRNASEFDAFVRARTSAVAESA